MTSKNGLSWLLSLAVLAASPLLAQDAFRFQQQIEVEDAGVVAVPLRGDALVYSDDLVLLGPDGAPLAFHLEQGQGETRPVRVLGATRRDGGWQLVLDAGDQPPPHSRLIFDLAERGDARGCRLESSEDRQSWRFLATADLFRLGDNADLARTLMDYPPTRDRYLRLTWSTPTLPELENIHLGVLGLEAERLEVDAECSASGQGLRCRVPLPEPAHLVRRLDVELNGDLNGGLNGEVAALGFRLWLPEDGRLTAAIDGVRYGTNSLRLPLDRTPPRPRARELWLDLDASSSLTVTRTSLERLTPTLVFRAATAGTHRLTFGWMTRDSSRTAPSTSTSTSISASTSTSTSASASQGSPNLPSDANRALVEASEEVDGGWPGWPERLVAPREAGKDSGEVSHRWLVEIAENRENGAETRAPEPRKGDVVSLELTAEVLNELSNQRANPGYGNLESLALEFGEKRVPFLRVTPEEPAILGHWRLEPRARNDGAGDGNGNGDGTGLILPSETRTLITKAEGPFRFTFGARTAEPGRPGVDPRYLAVFPSTSWDCPSSGPLPCFQVAELAAASRPSSRSSSGSAPGSPGPDSTRTLELQLLGDGVKPTELRVEAYRPRVQLLFVWPGAPVSLVLAEGSRTSPDLGPISQTLRSRPAIAAVPGRLETLEHEVAWPPWLLPVAFGLAALVLVWLLARMVKPES